MSDRAPIHDTIDRWHEFLGGDGEVELEDLLHPDVVFWSPVVHRPQPGRDLTMLYLNAAYQVFPGDDGPDDDGAGEGTSSGGGGFRYTKRVLDGRHAVLEFETRFGDVEVNGVDIITCDDDGRIVEFKVMLRPQRAVETARERMGAMLASMTAEAEAP